MTKSQAVTFTIDGNEAAARIAHKLNEVIAIYPITPASPMGEWADEWSAKQIPNLWGTVPQIVEMQSEGGAAGAIHGALQLGALSTTFTASQGLLLMIPNMYKIAGELTPTVFHIASRSLASQALSIFGDHSDVMAARATGFGMLCSNSPQEVLDMALIAHAATLEGRIPLLHFFDGFRTSHEIRKIQSISDDILRSMIRDEWINAHRARAMSPEHPVLRGSSQNPDIYFQARETVNPYYEKLPGIIQSTMDRFAALSGRQYRLFDYVGDAQAERVIVIMGSGTEAVEETVSYLQTQGERVGVIKVRLYRPFSSQDLLNAIPATARAIAVLDRTKEPGADGEPLYKDVLTAIAQHMAEDTAKFAAMPKIIGGRYGLSSKEFRPAMIKAIFDELNKSHPKNHFTIGIHDDVSHTSLEWDDSFRTDIHDDTHQAVFYGLGSDGTVSANKNSIKIIGDCTDLHVQAYFVYDSKKSGAVTISHLRFGSRPIHSTYLVEDGEANFVGCHQSVFLERYDMLKKATKNAVFLLNSTTPADKVWDTLPRDTQQHIIDKNIRFYTIDAYAVAAKTGMARRINTIMQTCFFAISGILPKDRAIEEIKRAIEVSYGKKGQAMVDINFRAVDEALAGLHEVKVPAQVSSAFAIPPPVSDSAPEFVRNVLGEIIAGRGDALPVSFLPVDGTFPTGTSAYEKRNLAQEIPELDMVLCSQCGKCPLVCPHAAIRSKIYHESNLSNAPATFKHAPTKGKGFPEGMHISYQVAPEDCTGCGLCVDICPIRDKQNPDHKAINMVPQPPIREQERHNWEYFLTLPEYDRRELKMETIKGAMALQPLFEFSGACLGCGETPYIKLATQLFGDRMIIANATGCSSIYGGNLPTAPWTCTTEGRGPAWNNSLFEDNAEFGMGMRVAIDKQKEHARELLLAMKDRVGEPLAMDILNADEADEAGIFEQRNRVKQLREKLQAIDEPEAIHLLQLSENLCRKSVWIIGGDGWAYDIGYGGLDHVLASGRDVNILVLDTEVYSNTGGQTSKSTPLGAIAKFSAGGKITSKKDLALLAMDYGNVYVAHVAYGAKDIQTLRAFIEAEAHPGPSLIIAYAPCSAHGLDLVDNHQHQQMAVDSGHWQLFRFDPKRIMQGENPLHLDSTEPTIPYKQFMQAEGRFRRLWDIHPDEAEKILQQAQQEVNHRFSFYKQLAAIDWDEHTRIAATKLAVKSGNPGEKLN
ncbi:MAG: pyruvate:ferredoxin (flavodoxin) oxidoreductase [Gammaproteobacteria bacterium]|nr:MAG: pyruvate:ferredoxin (flavodoxin) oxidoreductase [Gammaproteobacteria bacterium]